MRAKSNLAGIVLLAVRCVLVVILLGVMISTQFAEKNSKSSVGTVEANILSSIEKGKNMEKSTNRMLKKMYGLNAGDYEGVVFYKPVSGMDAQEMLIIKLKNSQQKESVVAAIEKRLASQKNVFDGYGIEQTALLNNAIIDARGNFVFYVVHDAANDADHAYRNSL